METFTQLPLSYDPSTKHTTMPSPTPALTTELSALNTLHRALTASQSDAQSGIPPPPTAVNPKRSAQITKLRESGNTSFRAQKYGDSIRMYSLGIDMAAGRPLWEPSAIAREELAGLYANRAQAHMAMSSWPEGAVDAKCSVELKKQGNVKAWWRRGKCLAEMGRGEEAERWVGEAIEFEGQEAELVELLEEVRKSLERKK
ncbi:tetratricopeptide [Microthyrium microscopicum]|uniref:Tetratricopeptide n=1 Tax=Microthyrium microscopicum TaxID=703497 RepID=A0A6A6UAU1_9PEZI|nr:tetratricopeptide [Microthyrium microscopicum]